MNPSVQWITLLWMLFSGAAMGVAFDSYRVLAGQLRFPQWSKHALDFLYWIAAAFFIFRMLYMTNDGQLRFYVFVGLFIGVWIYFLLWSVITQRFVVMLIQVTKGLLSFLYKLFRMLLWNPIKGILMLGLGLLRFLWKFLLSLLRLILKCLMPFWRLLKWMLRPITSRVRLPAWSRQLADKVIKAWKRWF
ncbi:spore cortex biosynthesis protein YabQ [Paenibacillus lautus]|jgi:spore cortex biosynthesis protein YabQ|uniref:Spore cortex biosynthesis protein YabQ n=1 Tax=Paenibacillus lautus TaxID=1401 RepID=A0A2A5L9J2_PAELA|nr:MULTISPECIES: spore cortex biosynthesis protein YabQ [Paenibacillus]MBY0164034.1 spore cortex biosynthesis protein YabQ [Cytobacillus firmus]VTR28831.1 spore cortex biosynthesis protein YabQ [Actinobacillus pleuropneumoniae]AYB47220.1 spore cortex biosynthesis protein YabQ [Paenibacillus lautus]EGG36142.1 spore cortex biosynthesis protein YabQ [Paenibacillus sp. HGF5]ETT65852.1 spore cortex biosynthesis protein YabQ [Paenibacillus sp. FSL H8-457]